MKQFHAVKEEFRKHKGEVEIPVRSSKSSAGYDFTLMEDITIPPMKIKTIGIAKNVELTVETLIDVLDHAVVEPSQQLTWTDVRVELEEDEVLLISPRSSSGTKLGVQLANTTGIIDSDYFNNPDTGGNIGLCIKNFSGKTINLKKGEHIAQGIIVNYLVTDDDNVDSERTGGFGSSGK